MEQDAVKFFRGEEKFNCAQAVFKAFQPLSNMSDDEIHSFANQGGGRAPEGTCGALYGALHLSQLIKVNKQKISDEFKDIATSTKCREIRQSRALSCKECVALAERLLKEQMDDKKDA